MSDVLGETILYLMKTVSSLQERVGNLEHGQRDHSERIYRIEDGKGDDIREALLQIMRETFPSDLQCADDILDRFLVVPREDVSTGPDRIRAAIRADRGGDAPGTVHGYA